MFLKRLSKRVLTTLAATLSIVVLASCARGMQSIVPEPTLVPTLQTSSEAEVVEF